MAKAWPRCTSSRGVDAHIVPQIVEAHLVVGAVGDVRGVGGLPLLGAQAVDDQPHLQAQEAVDLAHPLAVALGQIVVHRDDVDAPAGQGVEIRRAEWPPGSCPRRSSSRRCGPGAARYRPPAAPGRAHAQHPVGGFPTVAKGLRQDVVRVSPFARRSLNSVVLALSWVVAHGLVFIGHGLDLVHDGVDGFQLPGAVIAKNFFIRPMIVILPFRAGPSGPGNGGALEKGPLIHIIYKRWGSPHEKQK